MSLLSNLSLRMKILSGFMAVMLLTVVLGVIAFVEVKGLGNHIDDFATDLVPSIKYLNEIEGPINNIRRAEILASFKPSDPAGLDKYLKRFQVDREQIAKSIASYDKMNQTAEEKARWGEAKQGVDRYFAAAAKTFELVKSDRRQEAVEQQEVVSRKEFFAGLELIGKIVEYNNKEAVDNSAKFLAEASRSRMLIVGLLVACIVLSLLTSLTISSMITRPILRLSQEVGKVAEGDLNISIEQAGTDEVGRLTHDFKVMVESLRNVIGQVSSTANQVATAAAQLMGSAEQIANGAEEVASQAATVATASEQMSGTSGAISQNCQIAAEVNRQASSKASTGSEVVEITVQVMGRIASRVHETAVSVGSLGSRGDQIGEIVGTIQDIADQTNLLALNAAIEAARAGEQGRGFAVVADEVRALAERTTKATGEIGGMIKAIQVETKSAVAAMEEGVSEVEQGTAEAAKSGQALQEILDQINAVSMQINQVATASEEQTATTGQISENIHQITDVIQETAKGAHETATAAHQLAQTAEELQRLVAQFKL